MRFWVFLRDFSAATSRFRGVFAENKGLVGKWVGFDGNQTALEEAN